MYGSARAPDLRPLNFHKWTEMLFLPVKLIQAGESGGSGMLRKRCKLVSLEHHGRLNVAESVIFKSSKRRRHDSRYVLQTYGSECVKTNTQFAFSSLLSCPWYASSPHVPSEEHAHTESGWGEKKNSHTHTHTHTTHDWEGPPDKLTWSQQGLFDQRHEAKWALGVNCLCNAPDLQWREKKKKEIPTLFHTYVHLRKINGSRSRNKWEKVGVR